MIARAVVERTPKPQLSNDSLRRHDKPLAATARIPTLQGLLIHCSGVGEGYTGAMAAQQFTKPNARTYSLEDIVGEVLDGGVRIPDFQRAFRWQWDDAKRLLDSIVRGYPIGSLLLWSRSAPAARLSLGALTIDAPQKDEALWVVDGQQRLTSLASALNDAGSRDPRFAIVYDLAHQQFAKPADGRPHLIALPVIFDLQRLLKWFSEHAESAQYFEEGTRVAKAIRQYTIPAYIVKQEDEEVLRDIFDRMNNYGKRLTRAEVFSALHAGARGDGPPRAFPDIVEHIEARYGFGGLDEDTVLRAILARRSPDVTRDIRAEFSADRVSREFPDETADQAYRAGEEALSRAVAFLQEDAGVPHFGFLTYRYLLVVLTRFFAHHPEPAQRNRELLRRWFWRAAMVGPVMFSGWTQAMRALAAHVKPNAEVQSVQALLDAVSRFPLTPPMIAKFRSTSASSRMLLCALWALRPRSVLTGEPYDRALLGRALEGRKTAADIVFTVLKREPDGGGARAANRIILLGDDSPEDARDRLTYPPLGMTNDKWGQVLASHAFTFDFATCLANGQSAEFLAGREKLLTSTTHHFLSAMTESQFEDTPPLEAFDLDDDERPELATDGEA